MVELKRELLSPCGLYCGVCAVYIAHRDNNLKFKKALTNVYKPFIKGIEDIKCTGCLSDGEVFPVCRRCPIKDCNKERGTKGCYECEEFPCKYIKNFPLKVGKKVILRAIPTWRELGTAKFVEMEEKRYACPECGNYLFRGAKRCNKCKIAVDLD
ncbi:MAG: DUF3795 domain-containing protein [Candidatus Lokiarchaeota archaeon]|nr:DUF3795 domain-containing protein [Candidatus Lokiarchaeota archaeon]MBD3202152.1 DUF3795 domain-containing protein [Candidatus Lokiarchaeota archaeon]